MTQPNNDVSQTKPEPAQEPQTAEKEAPEGAKPTFTGQFDPERAANTIAALREEVRQLKDKNRSLAGDAAAAETLRAENETLRIVNAAISKGMGPQEAQDAAVFIDRTVFGIDVDKAFSALRKQRPYLFRGKVPDTGSTNPRRRYQSSLTHDDIRRMSPEEIAARKDEIDRLLKSG